MKFSISHFGILETFREDFNRKLNTWKGMFKTWIEYEKQYLLQENFQSKY